MNNLDRHEFVREGRAPTTAELGECSDLEVLAMATAFVTVYAEKVAFGHCIRPSQREAVRRILVETIHRVLGEEKGAPN